MLKIYSGVQIRSPSAFEIFSLKSDMICGGLVTESSGLKCGNERKFSKMVISKSFCSKSAKCFTSLRLDEFSLALPMIAKMFFFVVM